MFQLSLHLYGVNFPHFDSLIWNLEITSIDHSRVHLFIQQKFIEHLLFARHCASSECWALHFIP